VDERQMILKLGNIQPIHLGPSELVSMKSNLGLPWEKMKTMAKYDII